MKIILVFQVVAVIAQLKNTEASYGFGDLSKSSKKVRIYLEDDETLLIPKKSKIHFVNPVISHDEESFLDGSPTIPNYISKGIRPTYGLAEQSTHVKSGTLRWPTKPLFPLDDLRVRSHPLGQYLGGYAPSYGRSIGSRPSLLHSQAFNHLLNPVVMLPTSGWIRGGHQLQQEVDSGIKPVTELLPDDLKYDFRTKTHSLR